MPMLILLDRELTTHSPRSVESQDTAQNVSYSLTTFITNYLLLNFSLVQFKVGYKCKNLWSCISKTLSASGGGTLLPDLLTRGYVPGPHCRAQPQNHCTLVPDLFVGFSLQISCAPLCYRSIVFRLVDFANPAVQCFMVDWFKNLVAGVSAQLHGWALGVPSNSGAAERYKYRGSQSMGWTGKSTGCNVPSRRTPVTYPKIFLKSYDQNPAFLIYV